MLEGMEGIISYRETVVFFMKEPDSIQYLDYLIGLNRHLFGFLS